MIENMSKKPTKPKKSEAPMRNVVFRIEEENYQKLEAQAQADLRSVSSLIRQRLLTHPDFLNFANKKK